MTLHYVWPNVVLVTDEDYAIAEQTAGAIEVAPEIPPECWNTQPVDGERAMAAVRAMCG